MNTTFEARIEELGMAAAMVEKKRTFDAAFKLKVIDSRSIVTERLSRCMELMRREFTSVRNKRKTWRSSR